MLVEWNDVVWPHMSVGNANRSLSAGEDAHRCGIAIWSYEAEDGRRTMAVVVQLSWLELAR
jgi:hypothetical protein